MLQLIVPSLFQTDEMIDLLGERRLVGVDRLLARGKREPLGGSSPEALLCQALGIARQQDWPVAPITLAQSGEPAAEEYWLRADPVHVRIGRDRLILSEISEPTEDEAKMLCAALAAHFGESFSPHPLRPGAWAVRAAGKPDIATTPLSQAAGRDIDPLLPVGGDAGHWRKLMNEVQMLLFHHPLNQAREARGEPSINSIWLWGGGRLPEAIGHSSRTVLCDQPDWRALAEFAGARTGTLPEGWNPALGEDALIILDAPHRDLRRGDLDAWLQSMLDFERNWLQPLLASGRPFRVDDPLQDNRLSWRGAYRWKFWRRQQKPLPQGVKLEQPATDPGVDAFGNRY